MVTEKEWDSPRYMPDGAEWLTWLQQWNTPGFPGKVKLPALPAEPLPQQKSLPVATAADGHVGRWRVPAYLPAAMLPPLSFPSGRHLNDRRCASTGAKAVVPRIGLCFFDFYCRDVSSNDGF